MINCVNFDKLKRQCHSIPICISLIAREVREPYHIFMNHYTSFERVSSNSLPIYFYWDIYLFSNSFVHLTHFYCISTMCQTVGWIEGRECSGRRWGRWRAGFYLHGKLHSFSHKFTKSLYILRLLTLCHVPLIFLLIHHFHIW